MSSFLERADSSALALALLAAMLGCWAAGWWTGRKTAPEKSDDPDVRFTDASLALLGLLLAFTFSLSLARHDQRRAMVVAESNAVGDFYTCATLLKEPHRSRLQAVIRDYAERKLEAARNVASESELESRLQGFQASHSRMTVVVGEALLDGTPIAVSLTNTLNGVTSASASRLAAYRERLPASIAALLLLGAMVPSFLMGLQQAVSARPHLWGTFCFMLLVTLVTYVIFDLNQPGAGTIVVSQEPFERLLQSMGR